MDRIEAQARSDPPFAALFASAYFGGGTAPNPVLERLWRRQDELIARGDLGITRIDGWFPLRPGDVDDPRAR